MRALNQAAHIEALVNIFGGRLAEPADNLIAVYKMASLPSAVSGDIGFVAHSRYVAAAKDSAASVLIVSPSIAETLSGRRGLWVVDNPYATYAKLSGWFAEQLGLKKAGFKHPSAVVHETARVAPSARLDAGVVVGERAVIGQGAHLYPNVVIYHDCEIGNDVIIHAGTVIGSDGFGFAKEGGEWIKIEQLGRVVIGNKVEIGSNCSLDRGALDDTVIGNGVKIDNLVQIAHNVVVGDGTAIAGCVGIAGSAVIGKNCSLGGSAGILGHLEICDNVIISSMSLVTRSIKTPGFYSGVFPLQENADWERSAASVKQLPSLRQRLRELERLTSSLGALPGSVPPDTTSTLNAEQTSST
jgi:UDP-3-O-[3-hydroxymyristoyl] glucosamine N-acyltransferase